MLAAAVEAAAVAAAAAQAKIDAEQQAKTALEAELQVYMATLFLSRYDQQTVFTCLLHSTALS
jgi:hypothetical protein